MRRLPPRDQLVAMISKIMRADGTEDELDQLLMKLNEISSLPGTSDLIFYPEREMSAEDIADEILNFDPTRLELPAEFRLPGNGV